MWLGFLENLHALHKCLKKKNGKKVMSRVAHRKTHRESFGQEKSERVRI